MLGQEAAAQFDLERVLLVPAGESPHKRIDPEPGSQLRLALCEAAVADDALFEVSDFEVRGEGPSYTVNTLEALAALAGDDDLTFLMGADIAAGLESWHQPRRVLELARIGIAARPGTVLDEVEATLARLEASDRAEFVRMPEMGISSSLIRERVAKRRPIRYLVPERVAEAIAAEGLYRERLKA